jgi:threonine aldolase
VVGFKTQGLVTPSVFASDNWSGLCPEALEALIRANSGSEPPYGQDRWTLAACEGVRQLFDHDTLVFFVSSGTAGNGLALAHLTAPYQSILCHSQSHIHLDECGATGFYSHGSLLKPIGLSDDAKLRDTELERAINEPEDLRFQRPGTLSLTQVTERGTVYSVSELSSLINLAKDRGLRVHMDGARFFQAATALQCAPAELSWKVGVDVLTLGASKIGGGIADAIVFFDHSLARGFEYRLKQAGQVTSKQRLITAPWVGLLESKVWRENAIHANTMAQDLEERLRASGISTKFSRDANMLFTSFSEDEASRIKERGWQFHIHPETGLARLVCGWDANTASNILFAADVAEAVASIQPRE